jgi:hypothetical protein
MKLLNYLKCSMVMILETALYAHILSDPVYSLYAWFFSLDFIGPIILLA